MKTRIKLISTSVKFGLHFLNLEKSYLTPNDLEPKPNRGCEVFNNNNSIYILIYLYLFSYMLGNLGTYTRIFILCKYILRVCNLA